jgi:hypothetical protein
MGTIIKTLFLAAIVAGAAFFIAPYHTLQKLTAALENEDAAAVDKYVDFDAVAAAFQQDFARKMGIDTQGTGIADTLAISLSGSFLRGISGPGNMILILKDKDRRDLMGLSPKMADLLSRGSWQGADNFVLYNNDGKPTTLLKRTGFHWEVVAIRIP